MNNKFQFVPPPKLPLQYNIPSNLGNNSNIPPIDSSTGKNNFINDGYTFLNYSSINNNVNTNYSSINNNVNANYSSINNNVNTNYSSINNNVNIDNIINNNYYNQQSVSNFNIEKPVINVYQKPNENNLLLFNKENNKNIDDIGEKIKSNESNESNKSLIKNSLLSKYIENDKEWFKNWHSLSDKNKIDEINSYKKIKYMNVFNSLLDVLNNIQKMKVIKNQLEEIDVNMFESHYNEEIDTCNLLEVYYNIID